jgi:hypothetical protein
MRGCGDLKAGDLILYPYLWSWRTGSGALLGDKIRPAIVLYRGPEGSPERDKVLICPITSAKVRKPNLWVDIPSMEAKAAGIRNENGSRVVISECNLDDLEKSVHMPRDPILPGRFSADFTELLRRRFILMVREKNMRRIQRRNDAEALDALSP